MENNTLYWSCSWCVTSVCVYVNHGRSPEDGYFRSWPGPWRLQNTGQEQDQLPVDASEKKWHNRDVSSEKTSGCVTDQNQERSGQKHLLSPVPVQSERQPS